MGKMIVQQKDERHGQIYSFACDIQEHNISHGVMAEHRRHHWAESSVKKKKTQPGTTSTDQGHDTKLPEQTPLSRAASREEGHIQIKATLVSYGSSLFFRPHRSLWKPGIPYPVHGRVLVEIQRPRSLHRKAVIQLGVERNQQKSI